MPDLIPASLRRRSDEQIDQWWPPACPRQLPRQRTRCDGFVPTEGKEVQYLQVVLERLTLAVRPRPAEQFRDDRSDDSDLVVLDRVPETTFHPSVALWMIEVDPRGGIDENPHQRVSRHRRRSA